MLLCPLRKSKSVLIFIYLLLSLASHVTSRKNDRRHRWSGNCDCSRHCTPEILDRCRDHIRWVKSALEKSQEDACMWVGAKFPSMCGQNCEPGACDDSQEEEPTRIDFTPGSGTVPTPAVTPTYPKPTPTYTEPPTYPDRPAPTYTEPTPTYTEPTPTYTDTTPTKPDTTPTDDHTPPQSTGKGQCPQLMWGDDFNERFLDTSKWEYQIGDGCDEGICGWGNNELQSYERDNVSVNNGILSIEAKRQSLRGKQFTSGRIRTQGLADFQFGRLEARIKIPKGQGMWPAFWLLPTDWKYGGWPMSGEIDIVENIGREASTIHGSIHYGDAWPHNSHQGGFVKLVNGDAFHENFHEFAIEWQPGLIRWTLDGAEYSAKTPNDISPKHWPFDERFHFILNVAVGGHWPGNPDASTTFPQQMQVDYVRVYDKSFGRLKGAMAVQEGEKNVQFSIEDPLPDYVYNWYVPEGARIKTYNPSGSSSIEVDFGTKSGYVTVEATSRQCGVSKRTLRIPVNVGGGNSGATTVSACGCGSQCSKAILDRMATDKNGSFSCRDRINWVMKTHAKSETDACSVVGGEFPSVCGQNCDPRSCNGGS